VPFKEARKKWLSLNLRSVRSATTPTDLSASDSNSQPPSTGQETQQNLIDTKQLEALVFAQLLASNIIKILQT
jgi:hypothetical protein